MKPHPQTQDHTDEEASLSLYFVTVLQSEAPSFFVILRVN